MKNFTNDQLALAKQLAYENWEDGPADIGFVFNGTWITNPFLEESGRFEFNDLSAMYEYYGEENVVSFLTEILSQDKGRED